jgi:HEAT repeat protein
VLEEMMEPDHTLAELVEQNAAHAPRDDADGARNDLRRVTAAGRRSVQQLIDAIEDPAEELEVRLSACSLLAWLKVADATDALMRAFIGAVDGRLMLEAAKAIEYLGAKHTAPMFVSILEDGRPETQAIAAWVLGRLDAREALGAVKKAALDPRLDATVRDHAIEAPWAA